MGDDQATIGNELQHNDEQLRIRNRLRSEPIQAIPPGVKFNCPAAEFSPSGALAAVLSTLPAAQKNHHTNSISPPAHCWQGL